MFTGLVEEVGVLRSVRRGAHSSVLSIGAREILDDLKVGDSVAVNGVCLTATAIDSGGFTADVMHETLNRSSLPALTAGGRVNLERALPAGGRLGGHITPYGTRWQPPPPCCGTSWRRAPSPWTASA